MSEPTPSEAPKGGKSRGLRDAGVVRLAIVSLPGLAVTQR